MRDASKKDEVEGEKATQDVKNVKAINVKVFW